MRRTRLTLCVACILIGAANTLVTSGCDGIASVTLESTVTDDESLQSDAMRTFVPPDSLSSIYRSRSPAGLAIEAESQNQQIDGDSTSIGPISRSIEIDNWTINPEGATWTITFELADPGITIPVRIQQQQGVRICRFRSAAQRFRLNAAIEIREPDDSTTELSEASPPKPGDIVNAVTPTLGIEAFSLQTIGQCPPLVDDNATLMPDTEVYSTLRGYLRDAVIQSTEEMLQLSPIEAIGLLEGTAHIDRESRFDSRLGRLSFGARRRGHDDNGASDPGVRLDDQGLHLDMAGGTTSLRAPCFPPDPAPTVDAEPAGAPGPDDLLTPSTDVAATFSASLVEQLLQSAALGGFYCLGLESDASMQSPIPDVTASNLRLDDIDLGHLPVSGRVFLVISPGAFPSVNFDPQANVVEASWPDVTIDVYGRIDGTRVRILQVTSSVALGLRTQIPGDMRSRTIPFRLDSLSVSDVTFESNWRRTDDPPPELNRWARRLANLAFENAFALPLPFAPMREANLTAANVRAQDLLVGWEVQTSSASNP